MSNPNTHYARSSFIRSPTLEQQEARREWVEALMSGDYRQNYGSLKGTNGAYCCLGVACDLYRKRFPYACGWTRTGNFAHQGVDGFRGASMPYPVTEWLGVVRGIPLVSMGNSVVSISHLNDIEKLDFDHLARLLIKEMSHSTPTDESSQ